MTTDLPANSLDYPRLARGVRLHWSEVRQQYWLLFPEGALALNTTAAAILTYCDSQHSLDAIVAALQTQFQGVNAGDVQPLLMQLMKRGLLQMAES